MFGPKGPLIEDNVNILCCLNCDTLHYCSLDDKFCRKKLINDEKCFRILFNKYY